MTINADRLAVAVSKVLNNTILKRMDIVKTTPLDLLVKHAGEYNERVDFDLEIQQDFGIFSMVITSAKIGVRAEPTTMQGPLGKEVDCIWTSVNLWYEHPGGGRNGSSVVNIWFTADTYQVYAHRKAGE